jgi:YD repeat-containing protein
MHSEKAPSENRVWYAYPGQTVPDMVGTSSRPWKTARVMPDGTTHLEVREYGITGNLTRESDVTGTTLRTYDPSGVDVLSVESVRGTTRRTLEKHTYDARHRPLESTDESGQVTTYSYNDQGQVLTETAPDGVTYYSYDANGYLQTVTGPEQTTSYTYDDYGRRRTVTDSDGTTTTEYDAFDRPIKVTYPDGTYEKTIYKWLDRQDHRDRDGRWTRTVHDALRRVVSVREIKGTDDK